MKVYSKYGFDINPNLLSILSKRDEKKASKRVTAGTLEEKKSAARQSTTRLTRSTKTT